MERALNINFSTTIRESISYWLRVGIAEDATETVTHKEVATVIDSIYSTDPCTGDYGDNADDIRQIGDIENEEELIALLRFAFTQIAYDPCKYIAGSYDYEAVINIYRSHIDKDYKLVLNNGGVNRTEIKTRTIEDFVKVSGTSVTLDFHVLDGVIESDALIESVDGSTVYFVNEINGYINVKYRTQYNAVTVLVKGTDEEAQSCQCLVFYKEMVQELTLTPPIQDEDAVALIGCTSDTSGTGGDDPPDDPPEVLNCFRRYSYESLCRCSQALVNWEDVIKAINCSDPSSSDTILGAWGTHADSLLHTTYVECPYEEGSWEGSTAEFYEETCCEPPPWDLALPICASLTRNWIGGYDIEGGRDSYKSSIPGDTVSFVPLSPESGMCGTVTTIQDVTALDCCDDPAYVALDYDEENSAEILADHSSGLIFWTGGAGNVTVKVNGQGFWLDGAHTKKEVVVGGGAMRIYTSDACGPCFVTIKDSCTETSGQLISIDGSWVVVGGRDYCRSNYRGLVAQSYVSGIAIYQTTTLRISQQVTRATFSGGGGCYTSVPVPGIYPPASSPSWDNNGCITITANEVLYWQSIPAGPLVAEGLEGFVYDWGPCTSPLETRYLGRTKGYGYDSIVEEWKC